MGVQLVESAAPAVTMTFATFADEKAFVVIVIFVLAPGF